ncbi:glycoside hydrolase family 6 protein [Arthrobacter sp. B1805]|uniref:glycoside hydrolase family 6 protein n=1 Tax=Arthrobacter sp. B1805 TaxID=2058892 RepID=UPI002157525A|nr:glycoside hydrolase family 6 protein [Arthrobacter sp. B1805]
MFKRSLVSLSKMGAMVAATSFAAISLSATAASADIADGTQFYVEQQSHYQEALQQSAKLRASGDHRSAEQLRKLISTPQAVWVTSGTPKEVEQQVRQTTHRAEGKGQVPVLSAYNLPFRDCSQYSAGGASSVDEYKAWIDGVAAGIEDREAVIILETDGLGIIPWYTPFNSENPEWCQPAEADPETAAAERFEMLNYAVDTLKALPETSVYLDGTHSGWLSVGDAADRLVKAGVQDADGFFLNVSNYELTEKQLKFGTWISKCIYYATEIDPGNFGACGSQYYPASSNDFSTWALTDAWYATHVDSAAPAEDELAHFVIDTSRNGQGPWTPTRSYPDPQTWCNPPARGLGITPTTDTGNVLADAFLWVKVPGESDGECGRGLGAGAVDPEWGIVDPAAGAWFAEQALDLIKHSSPTFGR